MTGEWGKAARRGAQIKAVLTGGRSSHRVRGRPGSGRTISLLSGEPTKEAVGLLPTRSRSSRPACGPGREGTRTVLSGLSGAAGLLTPRPWSPGLPRFSFETFVWGGLGASLVAQLVKNLPTVQRPGFDPWVGKTPRRRERLPTPVFWPGEFRGLYIPRGGKELDAIERLSL